MTRLARTLIATAVLSIATLDASAQTRVDRSGATDANSRVGSYGRNQVGARDTPWEIQNRISYGNVTGGKQFRGSVSSDPQAFRGRTSSENLDRFVRSSSGVTTGGVATYNANQTRAYYGDSRAVQAPSNFVTVSNTGSAVAPSSTAWTPVDVRQASVSGGDRALINRDTSGTVVSGGEVNLQYAPMAGQVTPYSIGALPGSNLSDYTQLNTETVTDLTPSQIKQNLSDDPQSQIPGQTPGNRTSNTPDAQSQTISGGNPTNNVGGAGNRQDNGRGNTPSDSARIDNSVTPANAPEVGTVNRMVTRTDTKVGQPDKVGTADADRASETRGTARPGQAAEDANREFNAQAKAAKAAQTANDQPKPGDAKAPTAGVGAGNNTAPKTALPEKIGSIAAVNDNNTPGLTELLTKAESQMKAGQFANAVDTYNTASGLAPRTAIVDLGRANAELGGAFYVRAEQSLRRAYTVEKDLLKSHVDLRNFLGDDRLSAAQKDLGDLVQNKANDTSAAVLLAYVYYNTGNEPKAQALLDVADKRANGRDPLVTALKAGWTFPAAETK